jgi:3-methyl-2-oxobutanoate hydroxymethyltransferase
VHIPTIGIGSGASCDGQVLVCTDLLGMSRGKAPKFVKRFAELADAIVGATKAYVSEVRDGTFPDAAHSYESTAETPPRPPVAH